MKRTNRGARKEGNKQDEKGLKKRSKEIMKKSR